MNFFAPSKSKDKKKKQDDDTPSIRSTRSGLSSKKRSLTSSRRPVTRSTSKNSSKSVDNLVPDITLEDSRDVQVEESILKEPAQESNNDSDDLDTKRESSKKEPEPESSDEDPDEPEPALKAVKPELKGKVVDRTPIEPTLVAKTQQESAKLELKGKIVDRTPIEPILKK